MLKIAGVYGNSSGSKFQNFIKSRLLPPQTEQTKSLCSNRCLQRLNITKVQKCNFVRHIEGYKDHKGKCFVRYAF